MDYCFDSKVASLYGIDGALLYQYINQFQVSKNPFNIVIDGEIYVNGSVECIHKNLSFISKSAIRTALSVLFDAGVIVRKNNADNPFDKSYYYRVV